MHSSIIVAILLGVLVFSYANAGKRHYNEDELEQLYEALAEAKRGASYPALTTYSRCQNITTGDNYGGDMDASHPILVYSAMECGGLCEKVPDCWAWTFNFNGKCWLKNGSPSYSSSSNTYTGTCKKSS